MKIILEYREPETTIGAYIYSSVYDETEIEEALQELYAAKRAGYQISKWQLVHDEDIPR